MGQKHDENRQCQLDNSSRGIDHQTFLKMLDQRRFKDEIEMWRLDAYKGAEEVKCLRSIFFLDEKLV